jgi:hypothetical protein
MVGVVGKGGVVGGRQRGQREGKESRKIDRLLIIQKKRVWRKVGKMLTCYKNML